MVILYRQNLLPIKERPKKAEVPAPMLRTRAQILFEMIQDAAEDGKPCPTTNKIAEVLGYSSTASVQRILIELLDAGLIEVEVFNAGRIVTICATGKKTAQPKNMQPHWRKRRME
jgi:CTP-dependent riboflavin kinase